MSMEIPFVTDRASETRSGGTGQSPLPASRDVGRFLKMPKGLGIPRPSGRTGGVKEGASRG